MIARLIRISCAIALITIVAGCGGGGDDGGASAPPSSTNPPAPPSSTGIGAAGGTVTGPSGSQVVVPAGALATSTAIVVAESGSGAPPLPTGGTPFGPIIAFTPHGTTFAVPVTIRVPFDPAKVPAGTTPVLYKTTDATLSTWAVVTGATVNGSTMSGQVTGFSLATVGPPPLQKFPDLTKKVWDIRSNDVNDNPATPIDAGTQVGSELRKAARVGRDLPLRPFPDSSPRALVDVFSNDGGTTFWTFAEAPRSFPDDKPDLTISSSQLTQTYTFKKNDATATLKFLITRSQLDALDFGGNAVGQSSCPWLPENPTEDQLSEECRFVLLVASNTFTVEARQLLRPDAFFSAGGHVELNGSGPVFFDSTSQPAESLDALWDIDDYVFADTDDNAASIHLTHSIPINIPLDSVLPGEIFNVVVSLRSDASNLVQGESYAGAYLRDPLDSGADAGAPTMSFTGLEPLPPREDPLPEQVPQPCTSAPDPQAGSVQFGAADFRFPERRAGAGVILERRDGTKGDVRVLVETADGSAVAGSDYQPVKTVVRFKDGLGGRRLLNIPLVLDTAAEADETVNLKLTMFSGCATLGAQSTATVTILDDDRPVPVVPTFTLGGTVTGLAGSGLVLNRNGAIDQVQPVADGAYSFPRHVTSGTSYAITVGTQPTNPAQICTVSNGNGTVAGANITNILVNCTTPQPIGSLDSGFGALGKVTGATGGANVLAVQADGKLLALGNLTLSRYNTDGSVDTGFGSSGTVKIVTNGGGLDKMTALAVQADGKILVVGYTSLPTSFNEDFMTVRFNPDGSADTSFGTGGRVLTEFSGNNDQAKSVIVQPDGKIVVAGNAQVGPVLAVEQDFAIVRYLADGTLDASFGTGGKSTVDAVKFGGKSNFVNAAALQADGGIVVVGHVFTDGGSGNSDMGIARFLANGSVDTVFGTQGVERIDFGTSSVVSIGFDGGGWDEALDVAIQSDGKIVVGGYTIVAGVFHAALVRLLAASGTPNAIDFGPNGMVVSTTTDKASGIALQADGKIVIAGTSHSDFGIERFTSAGLPDESFGTDGLLAIDFFGAADAALDVLVQADGKIVAGGTARSGTSGGVGIVRVVP